MHGIRKHAATAVVAMVVSGAVAVVTVGGSALGGPAAGPVVKAGFLDGPVAIPDTQARVAALNLPRGAWAIFAKLYGFDNQNANVDVKCRLKAGGDFDDSHTLLEGNSGVVVNTATMALQIVHNFGAPGKVTLSCVDFGVNTEASFIKITAIKAGSLTNVNLT